VRNSTLSRLIKPWLPLCMALWLGTFAQPVLRADLPGDEDAEGVELFERQIRPLLAATYPLVEIHQAQADFLEKQHVGKLVLLP